MLGVDIAFVDNTKLVNMNILQHFMGYGNPNAKFWFIGLDEYSQNEEEEILAKKYDIYSSTFNNNKPFYLTKNDFKEFKLDSKFSRTYKGYEDLTSLINNGNKIFSKSFDDEDGEVFLSNLFPLGRKNDKAEYDNFTKKFIFDGDFDLWEKDYWSKRKTILANYINEKFFNQKNGEYLICFGTTYISYFENIIKLAFNEFTFGNPIKIKNSCYYYSAKIADKKILCLYHPSYGRLNRFLKNYDNAKI